MTPIHILGFLYLRFIHATDEGMSADEVVKAVDLLHKWIPDARREQIAGVLSEVGEWHNSLPDEAARDDAVIKAVEILRDGRDGAGGMSEKQRNAVVIHLIQLAYSDGKVTEKEERFINQVKEILGIDSGAAS
ncbi:MAG: TerB family tellurite resistance protein [Myxococcales bacterium]|nr:TerB family tellurite resistance protein [Myxococcales bacterium]MCB9752628.1 TerB family tellurite resistance protein [Myxococcales bacterium]